MGSYWWASLIFWLFSSCYIDVWQVFRLNESFWEKFRRWNLNCIKLLGMLNWWDEIRFFFDQIELVSLFCLPPNQILLLSNFRRFSAKKMLEIFFNFFPLYAKNGRENRILFWEFAGKSVNVVFMSETNRIFFPLILQNQFFFISCNI